MTDKNTSPTTTDSRFENVSWGRIANIAGLVLLVAIVVPFVVFSLPQVVGADQSYVVLSGSMEPAMSPGDAVIVNDVPASEIDRNDVITFGGQSGDTPTTHRVIEVVERDGTTAFRTKGDANEDPDSALVTPDQIQGKVMSVGGYLFVIPLIGYVINFAGTQFGFVLLFAIPISLFVLNEIWTVVASAGSDATGGDPDAESETIEASEASEAADVATTAGTDTKDTTIPDGAGASDAAAQSSAGASEEADAEISFTTAELQLGLAMNAVFLVYSAWVAYSIWTTYDTVETWALGATGAVGASFLLLGGLYVLGGGGNDTSTEKASSEPAPALAPEPEPEPDHFVSVPTDEATTDDDDIATPQTADADVGTVFEPVDISDDTTAQQTNGDGQTASSGGGDGDPTAGADSADGEANE